MGRLLALLCMSLFCGSALAEIQRVLPERVQRVLDAYDMPPASYSAWVQAIGQNEPLLALNEDLPRNPASTIKLLTTFLALEDLGPAYTWSTETYVAGDLDGGRLQGDLYLKGYGDPYLVTERLWLLLRRLRQRGLEQVDGDLVIDNFYFDLPAQDPGAFDGQAYRIYNVQPDALLVNFNAIGFTFRPEPEKQRVQIVADPLPMNLEIRNELTLTSGRCRGYQGGIAVAVAESEPEPAVSFSGRFGSDCPEYRLSRSVLSAPEYAYGVVRSLWSESGGELAGSWRNEPVPEELEVFEEFSSPPLSDVIRSVNKWSNNVMTRQIFLTMAAERYGAPATPERARAAANAALGERGLDFPELTLDNGAGLSRDTRISARNLGRLLMAARASDFGAEFQSSLALAGLDGTMRRRFRNDTLTGRMHLKTGRLNGVFAMAGYVRSESGGEYVVVAMQNHPDAHRGPGEEAHSELLRWVYRQ
jgi:D-alanyl-D-alanine carboxypeptidase/D-alanyl-D-alanine-endopeptidase (penicillin-binding protein 4)